MHTLVLEVSPGNNRRQKSTESSLINAQAFQHLGYLERTVSIPVKSPGNPFDETVEILVEEDDSATVKSSPNFLSWDQYIVYSPSFTVPAFYFIVWDQRMSHGCDSARVAEFDVEGVQLTLDHLLQSGVFRFDSSTKLDKTLFGVSEPGSAFPLLSQGDHPVLGIRCWHFHPCESSTAVDELVNEVIIPTASEDDRLRCWMKMWFLVLGSAVNF
jgi:ubiquitin-like-conjugating enzyme ATG10